jgi:uncharacterized protein
MRLYSDVPGLAEKLVASAEPSITISSGVPRSLGPVRYWRELLKLKVRSLAHYRHTRRWLQLLNSHPAFSEYMRIRPRFLYKVYRPYLTGALGMDERISVIASHYQFVFARGLGPVTAQASVGAVQLAALEGKGGTPYRLVLRGVGTNLEREGELVLQLCQGEQVLCSTAFTFGWRGQCHAVNIGCVQGGKAQGTLEAIREATRQLHGLRPKQMLVTLVRQLGWELGCKQMLLVSNRNQVLRAGTRKGRVLADYDQLWHEMGAQPRADGDYQLECGPLQAPDMEAIPSKKRSEARKRHEMLATLAAAVNQRLCGVHG